MKAYGESVEAGTKLPQVKGDTIPEAAGNGITYYVDADGGNDSYDGTAENRAWKSIEKVNSIEYKPGDRILFKAGCTWEAPVVSEESLDDTTDTDRDGRPETFLAPKGSGTEEANIILGAYGEGTLPKILGEARVNSVLTLVDQEYWDISNLEISNGDPDFDANAGKDKENAKLMGNLRGIHIYGQSHSDDGIIPGGTLDGYNLHDLYVHDVSGHVYWGSSPADRGYPGVFGMMGQDASKRTGGIIFEVWEPTTESDLTKEEKQSNTQDRTITFNNVTIQNNIVCNNSFGGICFKQWDGRGHEEVDVDGFYVGAVEATYEEWCRRDGAKKEVNNYEWAGYHPHTNIQILNNYVSQKNTEYGCNTIRVASVQGALVAHNVCVASGTCAIELDYADDIVVQYNAVYDTRKKMGGADNNGIDADMQTTNCLIQYNYLDNNGDGFLLCGIDFSEAIWRYNVIANCGSSDNYLSLWGDKGYNYVHNNLFYNSKDVSNLSFVATPGDKSAALNKNNPLYVSNNIFYHASEQKASAAYKQSEYAHYNSNCYYGNGITASESDKNAVIADPKFTGDIAEDLNRFAITTDSQLINSGSPVIYPDNFSGTYVDKYMDNSDLFGQTVDLTDKPDIGISEYQFREGMGIIRGYVKDSYGNPAAGAVIMIEGFNQTAMTQEDGYYCFGEIPAGTYTLCAKKEAYDDGTPAGWVLTEGNVVDANLVLGESQMDTGMIEGVITSGGIGVADVTITLTLEETVYETTTDETGQYSLLVPAAYGYELQIEKEGYREQTKENIEIQKGTILTYDCVLHSDDFSKTVYFINDDFNDYDEGTFSSNDVWSVYGTGNGSVSIKEDSEHAENKYLKISKTSSNKGIGVYNKENANLTGIVTIEARVMRTNDTSGSNQFGMYSFHENDWNSGSPDSSKNPIATFALIRSGSGSKIISHHKNNGVTTVVNAADYSLEKWNTIRCVANLDTKTYDFYVDDMTVPVFTGYKLRNDSRDVIDRFLFYANAGNKGDLCIDYVRICTGTPYDNNDASLLSVKVDDIPAVKVRKTEYEITVSEETEKVMILPTAQSIFASVEIGGVTVEKEPVEITLSGTTTTIPVMVTAGDGTTENYTLTVKKADSGPLDIMDLKVETLPDKKEYIVGEKLDVTGMVVTASTSNAARVELTEEQYTVSELDSSVPGEKEITVSAISGNGKTYHDTFMVLVSEEEAIYYTTKIKVTQNPDRTTYYTGEEFDTTGMVVKAVRQASPSNAEKIEVPVSDYETEYDFTEPGERKVVISHTAENAEGNPETFTTHVMVTVKEDVKEEKYYTARIRIARKPDKLVYLPGDTFNPEGIKVVAVEQMASASNATREVDITDEVDYLYDFSASGTQKVGVVYYGTDKEGLEKRFKTSVTVEVVDQETGIYTEKIAVVVEPDKKVYYVGDAFDSTGMVVKAFNVDRISGERTEKEITEYKTSPALLMVSGLMEVDISYASVNKEGKAEVFHDSVTVNVKKRSSSSSGSSSSFSVGEKTDPEPMTGQWIKNGEIWNFKKSDGSLARQEWGYINGKWYYFDQNSVMNTGWITYKEQWYYLNSDGSMAEETWILYNGKWYYLQKDGIMMAGQWLFYKEEWYYLNTDGAMAADCTMSAGYRVDAEGKWIR